MIRIHIFKNLSLFIAFGVMGLVTCLIGATYLHMEKLFDVSSRTMSLSLTGIYSGGLLGALFCATLYHRINPELNMALTNALAGLATIAAHYAPNFASFVFFMSLQGVAFGILFAAAPLYLITMWKDTKWNRPVLNCLYTFWSVGALIGPFIIRLFICHIDNPQDSTETNITEHNSTLSYIDEFYTQQFSHSCLKLAQSAFLLMGSIIFTTSIPFFIIFTVELFRPINENPKGLKTKYANHIITSEDILLDAKKVDQVVAGTTTQPPTSSKAIVGLMLFFFTALTISIECITMQYVVNFASKYLQWSVRSSSYLITVFFTAHAISRALNIVILIYIRPVILLTVNVIMCIVAFITVAVLIDMWPNTIYLVISVVGFMIATTYPTEILYISENVQFTQNMSAVSAVGTSMGGVISPFLVTSLISHFGLIFFTYYQAISSVLLLVVLIIQMVYFRRPIKLPITKV